jgi:SAM-dependent methyltransferase
VASVLRERGGPILDLACGPGHLTHYFCAGEDSNRPVVGVDRNFFRLWVARNFVAPRADFVCQWIDRPLPFSTGFFDSAFCSDAFHLVLNKAGCVGEALRVSAPDGLLGIVRFGNAALEPREGHELSVDGYERLFHEVPHVFVGEDELVASYLSRKGLDLGRGESAQGLGGQKWISAVLSADQSSLREYAPPADWPHSEGHLVLNPIYRMDDTSPSGEVTMRFEFPSEWYEFENAGYREYAPESAVVSREQLAALSSGQRSEAVRDLIDRFVAVGAPDRYMPERRPRSRTFHRR